MVEPEEFGNILLRSSGPGGALRLKDVARIELGAQSYDATTTLDGEPTIGIGIYLQSGANAQLRDPQRANGVVTLRPGDTLDILIEYTGLAANRADLINKAFLTSATDQDAVFGDIANGATFTF